MPILKKKSKELAPGKTLVIGFFLIIIVGAFLLCLPFSAKNGNFTDFVDCLFTAASATCVTGISVVETYIHWSVFGQCVIMTLIQIGGLGFISLITFFNLAIGRKLGLVKASSVSSDVTMTGLAATKTIFMRIVLLSFAIETVGALVLMIRFVPLYGGYGAFMAFFTAVSAFCNAGFDLMGIEGAGTGLSVFAGDPLVLITLIFLIVIGGLGFVVWEDIIAYHRRKKLTLHTKIVLIVTASLIVTGTLIYLVVELAEPEIFGDYSAGKMILTSFFASVSARTAGFCAAPLPTANAFSKLFTSILMFIGAAPGSTAGGIKVTTIAIVVTTAWSVINGRDEAQIMKHTVSKQTVYKTLTTLFLALMFVFVGFFALHLLNPEWDAVDSLFEAMSAFSTTGFSTGLSEASGTASKLLLSFIMFAGRVGPASLMLMLTPKNGGGKTTILPKGEIMAG